MSVSTPRIGIIYAALPVNYKPNGFGGPVQDAGARAPARHRMAMQAVLPRATNPEAALKTVPRFIQVRHLGHFFKADPDYVARVATGLGIPADETRYRGL